MFCWCGISTGKYVCVFHDGEFVAVEEEAQSVYMWIEWRICEGMPRGEYVCSRGRIAKVCDVL